MFTARRWHVFFRLVVALIVGVTVQAAGVAEDRLTVHGKTVLVNEMEMYYELHGGGQPLVLLHGFGRSGAVWRPFVADFSEHYQLIIPDLRGHGRSTNPSKNFTHRQSALDVFALLDALHIDQFRAVGISTGGMTLLHMATSQPRRVESMVLVGATSYFPRHCREIMADVQFDQLGEEELSLQRSLHKHGDEQIRLLVDQFHAFKDS
jgi:pimeloyl-ACP methyl ester carboxylesterase